VSESEDSEDEEYEEMSTSSSGSDEHTSETDQGIEDSGRSNGPATAANPLIDQAKNEDDSDRTITAKNDKNAKGTAECDIVIDDVKQPNRAGVFQLYKDRRDQESVTGQSRQIGD
jgi:hypothetical protein